jgi:hypothetical protein
MSARQKLLVPLGVALFLGVAGCSKDEAAAPTVPTDVATSRHPHLQWKRYSALEADLVQALELKPEELCTEFGLESCINSVHLAPLGGNEPFKSGMLEPTAEPLATTPAVVDRLLLSACGRRAELDLAAKKEAKVFQGLDLESDAPAPDDERVKETVTDLYHRFLARDPDEKELSIVAELTRDEKARPVPAKQFATLACFAVGTSTEFLFF